MRSPLLATLLVALVFQAGAQNVSPEPVDGSSSVGVIVYAEGREITLLRDGARSILDVGVGDAIGRLLLPGDQVTTGEATHAEIQLLTSSNIVRVAENTTFTVARAHIGTSTTLGVTFGRLRARVAGLAGNERFELRGLTAVAGVRGTDFGYDQILDAESGELVTRIYCFDGEVPVAPLAEPDAGLTIRAGEMVVVPEDAAAEDITVEIIDEEIAEFWAVRPFAREPAPIDELHRRFPDLLERTRLQLGALPPALRISQEDPDAGTPPDEAAGGPPGEAEVEQPAEPSAEPLVQEPELDGEREITGSDARTAGSRSTGLSRGLRTTGVVLTGAGILTDLAAVGLFYFGEDLIPGWTSADNAILRPIAAGGLGALAGGIVTILVSLAIE
jgi:hypothetical protein